MKFLSISFCFLMMSCATKAPYELGAKFSKVEIDQKSYVKPEFYYSKFKAPMASRSIASMEENELTNKEAYFLGMWRQKIKMEKVLGLTQKSKNYCPAFHNHLLKYEKELGATSQRYSLGKDWMKLASKEHVVANPVLALPVDSKRDLFTFIHEESFVDTDTVKEAFENYYKITKNELKELCETGASEGYFVFANYAKYYSTDNSFNRSEQALQALLKVTPVTNFYLLDSIKVGGVSGPDYFESQMLKKLKAGWFGHYVDDLNQVSKNKVSYIKE
ncbi:MAG: hypothetical protein KC478_00600 [Bacteriovoracaceae bacterium]|nr:hypothetical protein [Bacteriovoracaceae bacterium]